MFLILFLILFFFMRNTGEVTVAALSAGPSFGASMIAVADAGTYETNPGWTIRNVLYLLHTPKWQLTTFTLICMRGFCVILTHSICSHFALNLYSFRSQPALNLLSICSHFTQSVFSFALNLPQFALNLLSSRSQSVFIFALTSNLLSICSHFRHSCHSCHSCLFSLSVLFSRLGGRNSCKLYELWGGITRICWGQRGTFIVSFGGCCNMWWCDVLRWMRFVWSDECEEMSAIRLIRCDECDSFDQMYAMRWVRFEEFWYQMTVGGRWVGKKCEREVSTSTGQFGVANGSQEARFDCRWAEREEQNEKSRMRCRMRSRMRRRRAEWEEQNEKNRMRRTEWEEQNEKNRMRRTEWEEQNEKNRMRRTEWEEQNENGKNRMRGRAEGEEQSKKGSRMRKTTNEKNRRSTEWKSQLFFSGSGSQSETDAVAARTRTTAWTDQCFAVSSLGYDREKE